MSRGEPITEKLNLKISTQYRAIVLKIKCKQISRFQNVNTCEIYQNGVETMKKKKIKGGANNRKLNYKINTQYFLKLKSTFLGPKSML